ncbi:MAG: Flagellum biosynthesis repressor protein FlbT [Olavius algarvensis Delta 4 endosymbiont]|nr:MAG: Flagellum biosynthesis repressor protein FlbT [Olavius algarvensis Delta 4 endosymbiont]
MALKLTLKPNEKMIIGGAVITNGNSKSNLIVENKVPILREKDILNETEVNTPGRRVYFAIQLMYIDEANLVVHHNSYWELVKDFLGAAPSQLAVIDRMSEHILQRQYYKALKLCRELINYEEEIKQHV